MIINPYNNKEAMLPIPGTRLLQQDFGLIGTIIRDPFKRRRFWRIAALYTPVSDRALGGIRAKLVDDKEFFTFVNQMDLEVLLEVAKPGDRCRWSGKRYAAPGEPNFYGFCVDDDDLVDDLYDRELLKRGESIHGVLGPNHEIFRRIHLDENIDVEEYLLMLWDADPDTGLMPDIRIETVEKRWVRVERTRTPWEDL